MRGRMCDDDAALSRPAHLAPHRPQDTREEEVEQREERVLEDVEELVGHALGYDASNRRCVLPTLTMSPSFSIRSPSILIPLTLVPFVEPRSAAA